MDQVIRADQVQLPDGRIFPKGVLWEKGKRVPGAGHKRITETSQLNVKQKKFAEMLADVNIHKRTTIKQYAKILDVCIATICNWKKLRPLQDLALEIYKENNILQHAISIQEAVADRAKQKGGSADARLYFDILKWMKVIEVNEGEGGSGGDTFNVDKVLVIIQNENK